MVALHAGAGVAGVRSWRRPELAHRQCHPTPLLELFVGPVEDAIGWWSASMGRVPDSGHGRPESVATGVLAAAVPGSRRWSFACAAKSRASSAGPWP